MTNAVFTQKAKPRIAIMGEFSAGKSTLCNMLMRARPLPERVTATRLAPVWMTKGPGQHVRITLDEEEHPIDVNELDSIPLENTRFIKLFLDAEILDLCDFIDFPGISDPNMDAEVWERVLDEADAVIWLTHATQAWRQSEAAVWDTVDERVREKSILLITRFDKLVSESDRTRVQARVEKETRGLFQRVFPISLTDAIAAEDDYDAWTASGASAFMEHLVELIDRLADARGKVEAEGSADRPADAARGSTSLQSFPQRQAAPTVRVVRFRDEDEPALDQGADGEGATGARVMPRRVRPTVSARAQRPSSLSR